MVGSALLVLAELSGLYIITNIGRCLLQKDMRPNSGNFRCDQKRAHYLRVECVDNEHRLIRAL